MNHFSSLIPLVGACLVASCNESHKHTATPAPPEPNKPVAGYCLPAATAWAEEDFTQWMTRAELHHFQNQIPKDQYFAFVEGRNNGGLNEFRAVKKPFPTDQYNQRAIHWGLTENELFDNELQLLRRGFIRKGMQVFIDASGHALHQIVWLHPVDASNTTTEAHPEPAPPSNISPPDTVSTAPATPATPATPAAPSAPTPPTTKPQPPEENPPVAVVVPNQESRGSRNTDAQNQKKFTIYTVVKGDAIEKIAKRQHTTVEAILEANNLENDSLHIGQKLKIPKK